MEMKIPSGAGTTLLCLAWFIRLCVLCLDGDDAIAAVVLVFLAGGFLFLRPLRYGASENLQELARVQLLVEDRGLREKWREEGGVARSPVPLLLLVCKVAGGGAKEDFRDW